ncbi:MAG: hypothetical protein HN348_34155, partial [Proteobacteria bacterium]|nr:hypothetical protein [Pseudomonadota bacterium]
MIRWCLALVALSWSTIGHADCTVFTEAGFRELNQRAYDAIAIDDVVGHGALYREIQQNLPCMNEQLPKDAWAEFLVGLAVVEHAMGRKWADPLSTAIGIHPTVKRDYGAPEIREFTGMEPKQTGKQVPLDAIYFLDGVATTKIPELRGTHVAQRFKEGKWTSRVLFDEQWPGDWIEEEEPEPDPEPTKPGKKPKPPKEP